MKVLHHRDTNTIVVTTDDEEIYLEWEQAKLLARLLSSLEKQTVKPIIYELSDNGWSKEGEPQ